VAWLLLGLDQRPELELAPQPVLELAPQPGLELAPGLELGLGLARRPLGLELELARRERVLV